MIPVPKTITSNLTVISHVTSRYPNELLESEFNLKIPAKWNTVQQMLRKLLLSFPGIINIPISTPFLVEGGAIVFGQFNSYFYPEGYMGIRNKISAEHNGDVLSLLLDSKGARRC